MGSFKTTGSNKLSDNQCTCKVIGIPIKWYIILFLICSKASFLYAQFTVSFSFKPDSACSGTPVPFTSTVVSGNTSPKLYFWNFGDGVTSNLANPIHTYVSSGCGIQKFSPILTVTDTTNGLLVSQSAGGEIYVKQKSNPQLIDILNSVSFSNCDNDPTTETADFSIKVQNTTQNTACIQSYTLSWGDGSPALTNLTGNSFILDHTYTKLGAFSLTITANSVNGCNGTTTYIVKNQSNPAIGLKTDGGTASCAPRTYSFEMSNYLLNSPGTTYQWDFGDDSPKIIWSQDTVVLNNGKIYHAFNVTSCGKTNNEFITTVTAYNSCSSTSATVSGIKMWNKPIPDFSISPALGCEISGHFCFYNSTTPGAYGSNCDRTTTYFWDFGNGNTSTLANPDCETYPASGPHTISLTATNKCGSATIKKDIKVQTLPIAIANADTTSGCVPFAVTFSNKSTDSTDLSYYWSISPAVGWLFMDGSNSYSKNPVLQFSVAGTYTVNLTVNNTCGSNSVSFTIHASDIPSVALPSIADNCFPFTYAGNASYTNNGSDISSYQWSVNPSSGWSFVSPSNTGSQNPQILFTQAGIYQLTVKVTNKCGTGDSISNKFEVFTPVQVKVGNDTAVCINSGSFQLSGIPSGGTWSGTNITAAGLFSPLVSGTYTLTYKRGSGNCQTQDEVIVSVIPDPIVNAGSDIIVCLNQGEQTITGNPAGGTWSGPGIVDSNSGIFNPLISGIGSFQVRYTYTDNITKCSNSDDLPISVLSYPTVSAEDVTLCNQPIPEQLTATPTGGIWSGPHVSPTGLFTPDGTGDFVLLYSVTDINGCTSSGTMTVKVVEPDKTVSAGNDLSICSSDTITLAGIPAGGTWSGTNITSTGYFDPVLAGNYELIYSTGKGSCYVDDSKLVVVKPSPKAAFTANNVCFGETTLFTDQSQGGGADLASWLWKYGDNTTSQSQNLPHYYLAPDTYSATLVVKNESGCADSILKQVEVRKLPVVSFTFSAPACTNVPVSFNNYSTNALLYKWDFGDGNTSSLSEPANTYDKEGSYLVKLTAKSESGCTFSDSTVMLITGPPPQPHFQLSINEGCSPLTAFITIDTSLYKANSSYQWELGNGSTLNSLIPPDSIVFTGSLTGDTVIYIRFASYNLCNYFVYSDSVLVHAKPLSRFDMLHHWDCTPVEVKFQNISTSSPDYLFWDFGDGTSSTEFEPIHTYTTGANSTIYNISLIARNKCGADTLFRDLLVKPNTVQASFTVNDFKGCEGDAFCFQNYSTDASVLGISNLSWNFGDGHGSSAENPCHEFTTAGTYFVRLTVDNGCGYDETFDTIEIMHVPQIQISSDNEACIGEKLTFTYSSDSEIDGKTWYFGDGDSSILSNPYHSYLQSGTYEVVLSGKSTYGFPACVGTASKQVIINPVPDAFILPDTSGCVPLRITFQGDPGSSHLWDFGNGAGSTSNPTHIFDSSGLFLVKLISENSKGCKDSDSLEIKVFPGPKSQFTFTSSGGYPEYLTFLNSSIGATSCFWDFGNGQVNSSCSISQPIEYSMNDNYAITLVTMNQFGCMDTAVQLFPVNFKGLFVPNALIPEHPDPDENLFLPKGIGIQEYTIQIFDTWGNLIWQSSALVNGMPSEGWNGRDANGNLYPQDVYAWRVSAKFTDGTFWSGNNGKTYGTVTLIR